MKPREVWTPIGEASRENSSKALGEKKRKVKVVSQKENIKRRQ